MLNERHVKTELRKLNFFALLLSPILIGCLYLVATTEIPKVTSLRGSVESSKEDESVVRAYVQDLGIKELESGRFILRYENYPPATWGKVRVNEVKVFQKNIRLEGIYYIGFIEISHSNITDRGRTISPEKGFPVLVSATVPGQSILQMLTESF
jgi:hypothetical protein